MKELFRIVGTRKDGSRFYYSVLGRIPELDLATAQEGAEYQNKFKTGTIFSVEKCGATNAK